MLQLITPNFVGEHNKKHSIIIAVIILLIGLSSLLLMLTVIMRIVIIPISKLELRIKKMTENKSLEFVEAGKGRNEITMLAGQFNDMVAKIKEDEKIKNEISEQLKETNHQLQQFAYSVSHDLKEPLRIINSYLQLIEHTAELSDQTREYMQHVMSSAKGMYALISELLEYSRTNSEQYPLKKCDTAKVVSDTLKELEFAINEKKAEISTKDLPQITGYEPLLKQIFRNLIINSLKYCKQGLPPKITVGCVEEQNEFLFYVEDGGIPKIVKIDDGLLKPILAFI